MPHPSQIRYRLRQPLPLEFDYWRARWLLELHEVAQSGNTWRLTLRGPTEWSVTHGVRENVLDAIQVSGIEVRTATWVGTVFRELERRGLVERVG